MTNRIPAAFWFALAAQMIIPIGLVVGFLSLSRGSASLGSALTGFGLLLFGGPLGILALVGAVALWFQLEWGRNLCAIIQGIAAAACITSAFSSLADGSNSAFVWASASAAFGVGLIALHTSSLKAWIKSGAVPPEFSVA